MFNLRREIICQKEHFCLLIDYLRIKTYNHVRQPEQSTFQERISIGSMPSVHSTFLFYIIHQIETKILIRREDDTLFQFLLRDA